MNFGVFYGLFPRGLQRTLRFKAGLDKSLSDCEGIISNLKAGYPNLSRWQEQARRAAAMRQYTQTFLGRRRYLPGIRSQGWGRKSFAERCALNTPIQGTAADILKLALSRLIVGLPERPCRREGRVTAAAEVHHIVPLSAGGTHDESNLMALCKPCHSRITAREGGRWGCPGGSQISK